MAAVRCSRPMGAARRGGQYVPWRTPLPATPIGLEQRSAEPADAAGKQTSPAWQGLSLHKRQNKFGNRCVAAMLVPGYEKVKVALLAVSTEKPKISVKAQLPSQP
ncbi:hypothetical protein UY3_07317 [Chelonia mydas]|uniref:Uncharacterized protein n=1 Tax=Chelonia mydas TaxID=8469 RepID=M7C4U2_CHEMY|nr:hypothetical protein UY3_07317 [Chelonia mydas]